MGGSSGSQQQQTNQVSNPWAPTQPLLQNIISQLGSYGTGVTPGQTSAVSGLQSAASGLPNFSPQATNIANQYLGGGANTGISNAVNNLQGNLSGIANPANLNPMNTPGLSTALQYMQQQIGNNINGQFAGAGRDLSPANSQAAAYGEAGALAPLIMGQYNANVGNMLGANNSLFGAANTANNAYLTNAGFGLNTAQGVPGFALSPAEAQLQAANTAFGQPYSNTGTLQGMVLPIAGLGGQVSGTSNTQTQQQASPLAQILGAGSLFGGQYSPVSGMSAFLGL